LEVETQRSEIKSRSGQYYKLSNRCFRKKAGFEWKEPRMNFITLESTLAAEALDFAGVPPRSPATSLILAALADEREHVQARHEARVSWREIVRKLIAAFRLPWTDFTASETTVSESTAYTPAGPFFYKFQNPCG
jgi:hypothetical protein